MKLIYIKNIAFFLLLCGCYVECVIKEIDSFLDIPALAQARGDHTWVFFDIDNTLLQVLAEEVSESWFINQVNVRLTCGKSIKEAKSEVLVLIAAAQNRSPVRLVDDSTLLCINELRKKGFLTFAITARTGSVLASATFRQLRDLGIFFTGSVGEESVWKNRYVFSTVGDDVFYENGVLFVDGKDKGLVLEKFFEQVGSRPEHLIVIDDSLKNLQAVECAAHRLSISCDCLHFTKIEREAQTFCPTRVANERAVQHG